MRKQDLQHDIVGLKEIILWFMEYAQNCHRVVDFPLFTHRSWHMFVYYVNQELAELLPQPLNLDFGWEGVKPVIRNRDDILNELESALFSMTIPGEGADRIRLSSERSATGREFGKDFHELAIRMFLIARDMEDLLHFE